MIILDACVLIGYLECDDAHHRQATSLLASMSGQYLAVAGLTWAEVLVGAIRALQVDAVTDLICRQLGVMVAVDQAPDWPLRLAEVRAITGLKMPDAVVFVTAETLDAQIATFDGPLAAAAARAGRLYVAPRVVPSIGHSLGGAD